MNKYTEAIDTFDFETREDAICSCVAKLLRITLDELLPYKSNEVSFKIEEWRDFWLAFVDLCAEVDDETIEALRTEIIQG